MKTYTIVAGVNGCGKSSLIGILKNETYSLGKIIGVNEIEGGKLAISTIDECLEKEICFTQETTLSGIKTLNTIKRAIEKTITFAFIMLV